MMTDAMMTEVFAFAKENRVNKTKLMEMVTRVVSMVEVKTVPTVGKVKVRELENIEKLAAAIGVQTFTLKDVEPIIPGANYFVNKLEKAGLVTKVATVEKSTRGRPGFVYKFVFETV